MDTVFIYTQKEEGLGSATFCFKFCPSPSGAKVHKKRDLAPMPPQKEPWLRKPVIKRLAGHAWIPFVQNVLQLLGKIVVHLNLGAVRKPVQVV